MSVLAVFVLLFGSTLPLWADDSPAVDFSSAPALVLAEVPASAANIAPLLQRIVGLYQDEGSARRLIKQQRAEQDALKTKLATMNGEFAILTQHQQQLQEQLATLETEHQARLGALRQELEGKLEYELAEAKQRMAAEFERDVTSQVQAFEQRRRGEIEQLLDQELQLKERGLQQLGEELKMQTQELTERLGRLSVDSSVSEAIARSASEGVAKRQAELETKRANLQQERDARVTQAREELLARLKNEQAAEEARRLTVREASLRQSMAELLHNTHLQEMSRIEQVRRTFEAVKDRYGVLA